MTILDRYIARQYLTNVIVLLAIMFSFVVTIDVSLQFSKFYAKAVEICSDAPAGEAPSTLRVALVMLVTVIDLWWPRLVQLFNYMLGVVMVGGMGFTIAQLVRHRELVAMMAGGLSLRRIARPIVLVGLLLSAVQFANHEFIIPRIAPLLTREIKDAGKRELGASIVRPTADAQGRVVYARSFDADTRTISDLHVIERDPSGAASAVLTAPKAVWRDSQWVLTDGRREPLTADNAKSAGATTFRTDLDPTALLLRRYSGYRQYLSWSQIGEIVRRPNLQSGRAREWLEELERVRFGRLGLIACNLLSLVVCLPFFLRREPVAMVLPALKCAPIAVGTLVGGVLGTSAAIPGLSPEISVFVPALIMLPLAIAATSAIKT